MFHHYPSNSIGVIPIAGLGNRIMVIASALRLIDKGHFKTFGMHWRQDQHCNIDFRRAFELDISYDYNSIETRYFFDHAKIGHTSRIPVFSNIVVRACHKFNCVLDARKTNSENEYIKAVRHLTPTREFTRLADQYDVCDRIGIHCRRADFIPIHRIPHNEIDLKFAKFINDNFNGAKYFLATDSAETSERFKKWFGGSLLEAPKSHYPKWDKRSQNSMTEAMVDMILLGRCKNIIADSHSTFAGAAGWLSGKSTMRWRTANLK